MASALRIILHLFSKPQIGGDAIIVFSLFPTKH